MNFMGSVWAIGAVAEAGIEKGHIGLYLGADVLHDDGWRRPLSFRFAPVYADLGINGSVGEFSFRIYWRGQTTSALLARRQSSFWHGDGRVFSRHLRRRTTSSRFSAARLAAI